jgi:hypothetical protein
MKLALRIGFNIFVSYFAIASCLSVVELNYYLHDEVIVFLIPVIALIIVHLSNKLLNKISYFKLSMDNNIRSIKLGILILELFFIGREFIRGFSILNDDGLAFLCTIMLVLNIPLCNAILRMADVSKDY